MLRRLAWGVGALCIATTSVRAQSVTTLITEGNVLPGGGTITHLDQIRVSDDGSWLLSTRAGTTNFVVLIDGVEVLRTGQPLVSPPGSTLGSIQSSVEFNAVEEVAARFTVLSAGGPKACVAYDGIPALVEGNGVFAGGVLPGSTYSSFRYVHTGLANRMVVNCRLSNSTVTNYDALIEVESDFSMGLLFEQCVARKGDVLPGQSVPVHSFGVNPGSVDMNRRGSIAFTAALGTTSVVDSAIYIGNQLVVQGGQPSGVIPGMSWNNVSGSSIALNSRDKLAYQAQLTDGRFAMVYDGRLIAAVGEPVGAFPGETFTSFLNLGPKLADSGEVLYAARWDGLLRGGVFLMDELLFESGVTQIGGQVLTSFFNPGTWSISPNGRYIAFIAELPSGLDRAFRMDRGPRPVDVCVSDGTAAVDCPCNNDSAFGLAVGCENSQGHGAFLTMQGGGHAGLDDTRFTVSQARPHQPGMLLQGEGLQATPFKDGILCMGNPTERIEFVFTDSTGYAETTADIAAEGGAAAAQVRYYQLWYRDPALSVCGTGSNLTQGLEMVWQ